MTAANTLNCILVASGLFVSVLASAGTPRAHYSFSESQMTVYVPGLRDTVRLFVISDTHLSLSDEREDPYRQYSGRMASAYDRKGTAEALPASLAEARAFRADAVFHLGDLVSFPSEYGIEWAEARLNECGIPWFYVSGNHDWHYEGMGDYQSALREEWSAKRLSPLYKDNDHFNYSVNIKGVKVILVDDSLNEILPSQVKFLKRELKERTPSLLMMHVPVAAPGTDPSVFSIGSPEWGAAVDWAFKYESRPVWPEHHQKADYDFLDTVLGYGPSHNLLGVVCGHVHFESCSVQNGIPTLTVGANAKGAYYKIILIPLNTQ